MEDAKEWLETAYIKKKQTFWAKKQELRSSFSQKYDRMKSQMIVYIGLKYHKEKEKKWSCFPRKHERADVLMFKNS